MAKLKGHLSIQGEDKLFASGAFRALQTQQENLLGAPLSAQQGGRAERRQLLDTVDHGLQRISTVMEQINVRHTHASEQLGRHESQDEKRWAHDVAGRLFDPQRLDGNQYDRLAEVLLSQATVSRATVTGRLG